LPIIKSAFGGDQMFNQGKNQCHVKLVASQPAAPCEQAGSANHLAGLIGQLLENPDVMSVSQLCAATGISHARLIRLCRRAFGFPPKFLLRRARFQRMLAAIEERSYQEWRDFIDPQYVDQSHLIRDFHYFLGMPPSRYAASPRSMPALMFGLQLAA
jgi:methylphosphotriester-DNA--protein-cysteine methyltransferase